VAAWIVVASAGGCAQPAAVGGPCDVGVPGTGTGTVTMSSPALECEGRVCLQVGSAAAVCSAGCRTDDDCQTTGPGAASACRHGFACAVPTAVGSYACQRFCVCRDDLANTLSCPAGT
jgi:hypothetical protein